MLRYELKDTGDYKGFQSDWSGAVVGKIGESTVESLIEAIQSIEEQIQTRKDLHVQAMKKLDDAEIEVNNFLEQFRFFNFSSEGKEKMLLFRSKSIEMAQAKSSELIECWKDINKLREEQRKLQRELSERQTRMNLLDSILR